MIQYTQAHSPSSLSPSDMDASLLPSTQHRAESTMSEQLGILSGKVAVSRGSSSFTYLVLHQCEPTIIQNAALDFADVSDQDPHLKKNTVTI